VRIVLITAPKSAGAQVSTDDTSASGAGNSPEAIRSSGSVLAPFANITKIDRCRAAALLMHNKKLADNAINDVRPSIVRFDGADEKSPSLHEATALISYVIKVACSGSSPAPVTRVRVRAARMIAAGLPVKHSKQNRVDKKSFLYAVAMSRSYNRFVIVPM
jgi:hypothetical protein